VLEALVERHQGRLFRYLLALTRDRSTSEDLFQETWLRVVDRGHLYDPRHSFVAWLLAIARNLYVDRLRRSRSERLVSLDEPDAGVRDQGSPSPFERLARLERAQRVMDRFRRLPPAVQEVLSLRLDHGLSLKEIARVTDAPLPTVKARLYRGAGALVETGKETCR
jgi:RNA polymerase sigma-70 factor (ECF subfamily)